MKEVLTLKTSSIGFPVISVQMSCTGSPYNNMLHVSPGQKRTGERQGKNHCTKKKKRWGKQRVTSKLKKRKQKGKVLKTKGQRFGFGINKCQMPLLFSTWRGDISLREAENVTLNLRNDVILVSVFKRVRISSFLIKMAPKSDPVILSVEDCIIVRILQQANILN